MISEKLQLLYSTKSSKEKKKMASSLDLSSPDHTSSESVLASILVARFLRSNNYSETLDTFIREAGLPPSIYLDKSTEADSVAQWTLEGIIQEKKKFDRSLSFERYGDSQFKKDEWSMPGKAIYQLRCDKITYKTDYPSSSLVTKCNRHASFFQSALGRSSTMANSRR